MANIGEAARRDEWTSSRRGKYSGCCRCPKRVESVEFASSSVYSATDLIYSWVVDPLYRFNLFKGSSKYSALSTFLIRLGITAETLNL